MKKEIYYIKEKSRGQYVVGDAVNGESDQELTKREVLEASAHCKILGVNANEVKTASELFLETHAKLLKESGIVSAASGAVVVVSSRCIKQLADIGYHLSLKRGSLVTVDMADSRNALALAEAMGAA